MPVVASLVLRGAKARALGTFLDFVAKFGSMGRCRQGLTDSVDNLTKVSFLSENRKPTHPLSVSALRKQGHVRATRRASSESRFLACVASALRTQLVDTDMCAGVVSG